MRFKEFMLDVFNIRCDRSGFFGRAPDAVSVISPDRALEVFDRLKEMNNIAYGYTDDGCYARAHLMCRALFDMGMVPEKAWAFETDQRELIVKFPHGEQTWWFHVAPVIAVEDGAGGVQPMVFDPSLFDGPVTLKEWGDIMQAGADQLFIAPCGKAPGKYKGDYTPFNRTGYATDANAAKVMRDYTRLQNEQGFVPEVFPSQMRNASNDENWDQSRPSPVPQKSGGPRCQSRQA